MASIIKKSFNEPEETMTPEKMKVESVTLDGIKVMRATAEPGWRWTKHIKPHAGTDTCQRQHFLFILSGRLGTQVTGEEEVEYVAGDVTLIPPGHDGWTIGDEPVVWIEIPH